MSPAFVVICGAAGTLAGWLLGGRLARLGYRRVGEHGRAPFPVLWPALALGALWALMTAYLLPRHGWSVLPGALVSTAGGVGLTWIDADVHRLPERWTLPAYPLIAALWGLASVVTGDGQAWVRAVLTAAISWLVFVVMALAVREGLGFGDVQLAGLVGLVTGWFGLMPALVAPLLAFVFAGLYAVGLILVRRGGWKTSIALGPWLVLGAVVALVTSS